MTGAIIFSLNAYVFELNSFIYILYAISWIPYIFLFINKFIDSPILKNFLLLTIFLSLQVATGRLDYFYFTQIFIFLWVIYRLFREKPEIKYKFDGFKKYILLYSSLIITVLITAIQIIPSMDFIYTTRRVEQLDLEISTIWSMNPFQLINVVFNNFFGNIYYSKALSPIISDGKNLSFFIYNLYLGIPVIILLLYGIRRKQSSNYWLLFISIIFLLLSMGNYTFIYKLFFEYFPGFQMSRYPIKLFIYSIFCISLIAASGAESLNEDKSTEIKKIFKYITILLGIIVIILLISNNQITDYINNKYLIKYNLPINNINFILISLFKALFISISIFSLLRANFKLLGLKHIFVLVILLDLTINSVNNLWLIDKSLFYSKPEIVNDITRDKGSENLYSILHSNQNNFPKVSESKVLSDFLVSKNSLSFNLSVLYKQHNTFGYFPGEPSNIAIVVSAINDQIPGLKLSNKNKAALMRMMGIRYYIWDKSNNQINEPDLENFNFIKDYGENGMQLWEVKNYLPRMSFKTKALVNNDENEILKAVLQADKYQLDSDLFILYNNADYRKAVSLINKSETKVINNNLNIIESQANKLVLKISTDKSGYIILANRYTEGWTAKINDLELPILKANYFQQAIRVPSGESIIKIEYRPFSFVVGYKISIMGIILFSILLLILYSPEAIRIKLKANDVPIFAIVSILIISVFIFPMASSYLRTPENLSFIGIDDSPNSVDVTQADQFTYVSKMRQGFDGNILYKNRYTIVDSYRTALFIYYTTWGNIARFFTDNLSLFYYISTYIMDLFLLIYMIIFSKNFFKETSYRILFIILASFSMGFSYIYLLFPGIAEQTKILELSADVLYPELSLFTSMINVSHFPFCIMLLLIIFNQLIHNKAQLKNLIVTSLLSFILALIHPFDYITLISVSGAFIFLEIFLRKQKELLNSYVKIFLSLLSGSVSIAYIYYVLNDNTVLRASFKTTNVLYSPPVYQYLMGFGIHIILAGIASLLIIKRKIELNKAIIFLFTWIITNFIILYSPFDFQRRFMMGLQIPIIILSVLALKYLINKNKRFTYKVLTLIVIIVLSVPSSLNILKNSAYKHDYYADTDFMNMIEWINNQNIHDKNIFSHYYSGIKIPAFTSNNVYIAHWSETINFYIHKNILINFFKQESTTQIKYLKDIGIDYVFYGPDEKSLGNISESSELKKIYSIGDYDLFKVIK